MLYELPKGVRLSCHRLDVGGTHRASCGAGLGEKLISTPSPPLSTYWRAFLLMLLSRVPQRLFALRLGAQCSDSVTTALSTSRKAERVTRRIVRTTKVAVGPLASQLLT